MSPQPVPVAGFAFTSSRAQPAPVVWGLSWRRLELRSPRPKCFVCGCGQAAGLALAGGGCGVASAAGTGSQPSREGAAAATTSLPAPGHGGQPGALPWLWPSSPIPLPAGAAGLGSLPLPGSLLPALEAICVPQGGQEEVTAGSSPRCQGLKKGAAGRGGRAGAAGGFGRCRWCAGFPGSSLSLCLLPVRGHALVRRWPPVRLAAPATVPTACPRGELGEHPCTSPCDAGSAPCDAGGKDSGSCLAPEEPERSEDAAQSPALLCCQQGPAWGKAGCQGSQNRRRQQQQAKQFLMKFPAGIYSRNVLGGVRAGPLRSAACAAGELRGCG